MKPLHTFGLDVNEARVYQALLELGPSRVSAVSLRAGLNRTTSYDILRRLMVAGIVAPASGVGKRQMYVAEHPTRLVQHLERQQRRIAQALDDVREKLPELTILHKTREKPSIKFFEGVEGLKQIFNETLSSKTEILSILNADSWADADFVDFARWYNRKRAQSKIHERVLALDTPKTVEWMVHKYPTTTKYTEVKLLQKSLLPFFDLEVNIYENKVVIALTKKPNRMGILIESDPFANALRAIFEVAWRSLPEVNPITPRPVRNTISYGSRRKPR